MEALARCRLPLQQVGLRQIGMTPAGLAAWTASSAYGAANVVDMSDNALRVAGARALAAADAGGAGDLTLARTGLGPEGAVVLLSPGSRLARWTRWLDLTGNGLGDEGVEALAAVATGLVTLDLSANAITDDGVEHLAEARWPVLLEAAGFEVRALMVDVWDEAGEEIPTFLGVKPG